MVAGLVRRAPEFGTVAELDHDGAGCLVDRDRLRSRRGGVEVAVRVDENLRPGLAFMTFHFDVPSNFLTIASTRLASSLTLAPLPEPGTASIAAIFPALSMTTV